MSCRLRRRCPVGERDAPMQIDDRTFPRAHADRPTCDLESSTSILAAGCVTVIFCRMVAPSFVMITSPLGDDTCVGERGEPRSISRGRSHHLVHAPRPQGGTNGVRHGLRRLDVGRANILFARGFPVELVPRALLLPCRRHAFVACACACAIRARRGCGVVRELHYGVERRI